MLARIVEHIRREEDKLAEFRRVNRAHPDYALCGGEIYRQRQVLRSLDIIRGRLDCMALAALR